MNLRQAAWDALNALETGIGESPAKTRVITALKQALAESVTDAWREFASDYERGVIDGRVKQAESSVDRAVNAMSRKPLTDEEIALIAVECAATHKHDDLAFARAIERAHGIGEPHGS